MVSTGLSRSEHPDVYSEEGEIADAEQIKRIVSEGFLDVFIDSNKGHYFLEFPEKKKLIEKTYDVVVAKEECPIHGVRNLQSIKRDIDEAQIVYANSIMYVKSFLDDLRERRKIDIERSEVYVNEVFGTICDNIDSLTFISKLKTHDKYTYTHNLNVSIFSIAFASCLGLGVENIKIIGLSGLFHDIGKMMIDQDVLNKPGKLTVSEFEEIKKHPAIGYSLLQADPKHQADVCKATLQHHEKFSGGGYPDDLKFTEISNQAMLISIVDVFDALTSDRIYKPRIDLHRALGILFNLKGTAFNPVLVDKFIKFLGVYPVGSVVELANGKRAIVVEQNNSNLLRPKVRVIMDKNNKYCSAEDIDLLDSAHVDDKSFEIVETIRTEDCRVNVLSYLY